MLDLIEKLLSFIFFTTRPNINGHWYFLLRFEKASHASYLGMLVQWQAHIIVDGKRISGSAERRSESSRVHPPFIYRHEQRQTAEIEGLMRYALRPNHGWVVDFRLVHKARGGARQTVASHALTAVTSEEMSGVFRGDASDSSGRVSWGRKIYRLPNITDFR